MTDLSHLAVHIYNVCTALDGIGGITTSLVDVITGTLALLVSHGVGVHHCTVNLHRTVILRHDKAVAVTKHHVGIRSRPLHSLLKVHTDGIFVRHLELLDVGVGSSLSR